MSKRKYTKMLAMFPEIEKMLKAGMYHREIEEKLGLEGDRLIHNLLKRQRRKAAKGATKFRGRRPTKTLQEYKYENKQLKMEVKLLQDFLQSTERLTIKSLKVKPPFREDAEKVTTTKTV